jgi:hypothetical protein
VAKMTAEQRAELERRLAEDDEEPEDYDSDDFEAWEEAPDGTRRGTRTTVRTARRHGPDWVKAFFAEKDAEDGKGGSATSGGKGKGAGSKSDGQGDGDQGGDGKGPVRFGRRMNAG